MKSGPAKQCAWWGLTFAFSAKFIGSRMDKIQRKISMEPIRRDIDNEVRGRDFPRVWGQSSMPLFTVWVDYFIITSCSLLMVLASQSHPHSPAPPASLPQWSAHNRKAISSNTLFPTRNKSLTWIQTPQVTGKKSFPNCHLYVIRIPWNVHVPKNRYLMMPTYSK